MVSKTASWYLDRVNDPEISNLFYYINPQLKNKKVLDLGCGAGHYLKHFSSGSVGIDVSKANIEIAKSRNLYIKFGDLNQKLDLENDFFDAIFCSHVLEHVDSPIRLLRECNRVLRKDGLIIIATPNEINLPNLVKLDDYFGNHQGHIYSFSMKNIKVLLEKSGFEILEKFIDMYLIKKINNKSPYLGKILLNTAQKVPKVLILPFSQSFIITGKKNSQLY